MSIKVNNISKNYGEQKALNKVSFEISKGEIVGFLGPNGAGKSTLMKIICCYLPPNSGDILVCDKSILKDSLEVRKHIGYLPENNPLYLDMYVKEFLEFIAGIHKIDNKKERISEMIELTGLQNEQHKKIGALSKGYRQRVGLAQAMIHNPEVLILDEPTTGLDPNQIVEIRNLIKTIGKEKTVMLSTHIMQEVDAICDRAIIINKGEIVADEKVSQLRSLQQSVSLEVEFENSIEISILKQLKHSKKIQNLGGNKFKIITDGTDIRADISKLALEQNNIIISLNKESASLESVFQDLTKG
jgi:ABC-2 type transport system ATP-binding protein